MRPMIPPTLPIAAVLLAWFGLAPARAQPLIRPAHGVSVEYRAEGRQDGSGSRQSGVIRVFWTDHGQMARVEMPGLPIFGIIDIPRDRMTVVFAQERGFVRMPLDPAHIPGLAVPPGTTMTRIGSDAVAGLGCAVWRVEGPRDHGTACITRDGLVLRAEGRGRAEGVAGSGRIEAVKVRYGPQPPALFVPPAGFREIDLPHIGFGPSGPRHP